MKIKEIYQDNRPRERLILNGPESLSDEELLAIIINTGIKGKSSIELSREIINSSENIRNLFDMTYNELVSINGIKDSKACSILASFELCKRAMSYKSIKQVFDTAEKISDYLKPKMLLEKNEVLYIMFLDSKLQLIRCIKYSIGNVGETILPQQRILKDALKYSTRFLVMSHNHPSGDPNPSLEDVDATERLRNALSLIGIVLLDHIVIGDNDYFSFNDEHLI